MNWRNLLLFVSAGLALAACADEAPEAEKTSDTTYQQVEGWETLRLESNIESAHPYANDMDGTDWVAVHAPQGATSMKIHFAVAEVERGYDSIRIADANENVVETVTGSDRGWTNEIPGDSALVAIQSDYSVTDDGFVIDAIQFKMPSEDLGGEWMNFRPVEDIQTPHPYENHTQKKWTIRAEPEAQRIKVNFDEFSLERGYDFVYLYNGEGERVATYTGNRGDFSSIEIVGNVVTVEFVSDYSITDYGFHVSSYDVLIDAGGCQSNDECGPGQVCESVQCVRFPCPSLCVDAKDSCETDADCTAPHVCNPATNMCEGLYCPTVYQPVCGVNGQTYSNACNARNAHVEIAHEGECGQACGARLGDTCQDGQYCHFEQSATCGWADATGTCRTTPEFCTEQYQPVCGCDGRTYGNACKANAAGTSVVSSGACQDEAPARCVRQGCSGQVCAEEGAGIVTTCEWRVEYACFQQATCERQADGECGWTQSDALLQCLGNN